MRQILDVAEWGAKISLVSGALHLQAENSGLDITVPPEEVGALILSHGAIGLSSAVLGALAENGALAVICGGNWSPVGIMQPVAVCTRRRDMLLRTQLAATRPLKKRLWQALVRAKIAGQHYILSVFRGVNVLEGYGRRVRSGDGSAAEAAAAAEYWKRLALFPTRDRAAPDANMLFNYAYTVISSTMARYLCAAGFLPHLGIHHHNQYNPFCLASDLVEPFRPAADAVMLPLAGEFSPRQELTPDLRKAILKGLYSQTVRRRGRAVALFTAMRQTVFSLRAALLRDNPALLALPDWRP